MNNLLIVPNNKNRLNLSLFIGLTANFVKFIFSLNSIVAAGIFFGIIFWFFTAHQLFVSITHAK